MAIKLTETLTIPDELNLTNPLISELVIDVITAKTSLLVTLVPVFMGLTVAIGGNLKPSI